jgi:hypothetical protein
MSKDIGVVVALPPDVKAWVDAQAEDTGINAAIWIRMLVFQARKRGAPTTGIVPQLTVTRDASFVPHYEVPAAVLDDADPDAWRGPVDEDASGIDVDAMVAGRLTAAESAGLTAQPQEPYEAFGKPPAMTVFPTGAVRALRRPVSQYSPATQPRHLNGF